MRTFFYVLTALIITTALVRIFVVDSFVVDGNSMAPAITSGDYVFVNKFAYWRREPERGDIVVGNFRDVPGTKVIKRVVGMPREWVRIEGNTVSVGSERDGGDAVVVAELYTEDIASHMHSTEAIAYRLDPHEYFLLGDNSILSSDSRELGPVDSYRISGQVFLGFQRSTFSFLRF